MTLAPMPYRVRQVILDVAHERQLPVDMMMGRSRRRVLVRARWEAMRRVRALEWPSGKPPSTLQIGLWFDRDHTTVLHALARVQ